MKYPLEIIPIPKVTPYVEPIPLALTEKSLKIIAKRHLHNDVVEVVMKLRNGEIKTYKKEADK